MTDATTEIYTYSTDARLDDQPLRCMRESDRSQLGRIAESIISGDQLRGRVLALLNEPPVALSGQDLNNVYRQIYSSFVARDLRKKVSLAIAQAIIDGCIPGTIIVQLPRAESDVKFIWDLQKKAINLR